MKNILGKLLAALIIFCAPSAASGETIRLVADTWPPFNAVPDSDEEGFLVDVARAVFSREGISVSYELLPWKRAVEMTRDGHYTGLVGASKTDAPDFIFPKEELSRNYLAFFVRKDSGWRFRSRQDIRQVALGVIAGYDYRQWLLDYIKANRNRPGRIQVMTGEEPLQKNILKLINHRIDAIVDNEAVILTVTRKMGVSNQIIPAGYGVEAAYIYIAFSPKLPDSSRYADILSRGIAQMRTSGELGRLLSGYGLKDWK